MRISPWLALASGAVLMAVPAFASIDSCYSLPGNLVANCGFEGNNGTGPLVYTVASDTLVPVSWTPNTPFTDQPTYNDVRPPGGGNQPVYQGGHALSIGNLDNTPAPVLSQTLTDANGIQYSGSVWVDYGGAGSGDSGAFFNVLINNVAVVSLDDTAPGYINGFTTGVGYTEYTFSFTGTGSDVLALTANTTQSEWFVDNISVTAATPEPSFYVLLGALLSLVVLWSRRGAILNHLFR